MRLTNLQIIDSQFLDNYASGLLIEDERQTVRNVTVRGSLGRNEEGAVTINGGTGTYTFTNNVGYP